MPCVLEYFFAVAHGVERRGSRADAAYAEILQSALDAADAGEPREIVFELIGIGSPV